MKLIKKILSFFTKKKEEQMSASAVVVLLRMDEELCKRLRGEGSSFIHSGLCSLAADCIHATFDKLPGYAKSKLHQEIISFLRKDAHRFKGITSQVFWWNPQRVTPRKELVQFLISKHLPKYARQIERHRIATGRS